MTENNHHSMASEEQPGIFRRRGIAVRTFISLLILGVGIGVASYLKNNAPKSKKRPPAQPVQVVQIETLHPADYQVVIPAMGTVTPDREIVLKSRVSGEVVEIHPEFTEGGLLKKDMKILQIDPEDYQLNLSQRKRAVTDAEYALKLELGHQTVAKREWELLNGMQPAPDEEMELALRKPHLEKARADLKAAQADLKKAMLELERTRITAPFNAMVRSASVDLGSQVTPQESLAELVGTDAYRIQVSVPVDRLKWIQIPAKADEPGSKALIIYGQNHECQGRVVRLMGDLSAEGRMARLLVEVKDPLGLNAPGQDHPPLLIGEYVRVKIKGRKLGNVFKIRRTALRDNSKVWVIGKDQALEIRKVSPIWRDADLVLLQDEVKPGEHLIVSDLAAPVEGMKVRIDSLKSETKNESPANEKT
ncbi:MAG: efflux RND transporter periplasmic adaptor subunit, partial [Desulfobacterales bacterium]